MSREDDEGFMRIAICEAWRVNPFPNPRVGAVIVRGGSIIGRGRHRRFGDVHAEVDAMRSVKEKSLLKGATMYVTLEPCDKYAKQPPCADALIALGVKRIVYACADPTRVGGLKKLRKARIETQGGILEREAKPLLEEFATFKKFGRPAVSLHFAVSLDGKVATRTGNSRFISNEKSRLLSRSFRARHDAILVGRNTVAMDDPRLTARIRGKRDPLRVILDSKLSLSPKMRAFSERRGRAIVVAAKPVPARKARAFEKAGVEVLACGRGQIDIRELLGKLAGMGVSSVLVEGGPAVLTSFIEQKLFDRVFAFVAPKLVGGKDAPTPFEGKGIVRMSKAMRLSTVSVKLIGDDMFLEAVRAFASPYASAGRLKRFRQS